MAKRNRRNQRGNQQPRRNQTEEQVAQTVAVEPQVDQTTAWFDKNKNLILGLIAAAVLLTAAFAIYKYFVKEPKEAAAKTAIFKAEQQFARDSFALALENPGGGYDGLLAIIDEYGGTQTGNLANLYAGISYLNLGRFEDAISFLESHKAKGSYAPILKNGNLGDAYSELGETNFDKAIGFYEKATTASEDALLTPYYLYKLGLLAKRQGNNSRALAAFTRIKNDYPSSEEANSVDMLLSTLAGS